MKTTSNGIFEGDNPLHYALPLAIFQICVVVMVTRGLAYILRPLRQPRVIAEIIGGILLGPSALGRNITYLNVVFPSKSLTVLDTLANFGLLFFMFLIGVELDLKSLKRTGGTALSIALAGISFPFVLGIGTSFILRHTISKGAHGDAFLVFMGVALSITAFPVLARILAELKLLTTDLGRMAMSAAAVNDMAAWILLAFAIALSGSNHSPITTLWIFLSGIGFILFCIYAVNPILHWMSRRSPEGGPVGEIYICYTLVIVLTASFITDAIGIHALFGAFIIGVLIPKDCPFESALVSKVEDLVSGLLLPLYFVSSGLKTNIATIQGAQSWGLLILVICTSCTGKILGTVVASLLCKVPFREALTLGFLMNTKGLVELIVLNIGKERKVLDDQTFAIMVLMALFTTFITTPLVTSVYKPSRTSGSYQNRTIMGKPKDSKLRILACFHSMRNIQTIVNLIEASRGCGRESDLLLYAMHLMELSERTSAIRMVHKAGKKGNMVVAFEAFKHLCSVTIRPMTAISELSNIHEDICTGAERKTVTIILLPYHKNQTSDGRLETTRADFQSVNQKVLQHAPCSVGILVDRGLCVPTHIASRDVSSSVTVLFFGGFDDYETLTYGFRMAEHPGVDLRVVHFKTEYNETSADGDAVINMHDDDDDDLISEFERKARKDQSIIFDKRMISSKEEIIAILLGLGRCSLFLAGRRPGGPTIDLCFRREECTELGPIGDLLTSPQFSSTASVLIIQQYQGQLVSTEIKTDSISSNEDMSQNIQTSRPNPRVSV